MADLLSAGVSKLGDALQAALPYVQKALDYVANNGPQVAGILGGLAGTFAAMKFAPLAGNILEGAGSLLFGENGGLGAAAGGSKRSGGLLGAVGSLFTGGQKFAGNAVGTISSIITNLGSAVMTGMQIIGSAIQAAMPIIQGIITVIMTIGSVVVPALLAGFEAFSAGISAVMSAIQGIFQGLITFITGVFSGSWSQAWEGIKQITLLPFL